MRTSKVGKFFMGLLLAMICFCLGLLLMMDKVDACLVEEESVEPEVERVVPLVLEEKVSNKQIRGVGTLPIAPMQTASARRLCSRIRSLFLRTVQLPQTRPRLSPVPAVRVV